MCLNEIFTQIYNFTFSRNDRSNNNNNNNSNFISKAYSRITVTSEIDLKYFIRKIVFPSASDQKICKGLVVI